MNIDSKQRFRDSEHAKAFSNFSGTEAFARAVETAMLQYVANLGVATSGADAAACWQRIEGAKQVLSVLANLTDPITEPKKPVSDNLDHKV